MLYGWSLTDGGGHFSEHLLVTDVTDQGRCCSISQACGDPSLTSIAPIDGNMSKRAGTIIDFNFIMFFVCSLLFCFCFYLFTFTFTSTYHPLTHISLSLSLSLPLSHTHITTLCTGFLYYVDKINLISHATRKCSVEHEGGNERFD